MSSGPSDPHDGHEGGSSERWLVSYADFITLMFAFFAVLYATSEKDMAKAAEFQESVKKYLIKAGGMGGMPEGTINQAERGNAVIESPLPTYKDGRPETVEVMDKTEEYVESAFTPEERKKFIRDVSADEWGVRLVLTADALYSEGSEKFRADAIPFITKLGGLILKTKRKVLIEGHVAPNETGSFRSTWDFSSARAVNLLRFFQAQLKLGSGQFAAMAMGDSRPNFKGDQAKENARIEVILLNTDTNF